MYTPLLFYSWMIKVRELCDTLISKCVCSFKHLSRPSCHCTLIYWGSSLSFWQWCRARAM